jgi:EpsI family protein
MSDFTRRFLLASILIAAVAVFLQARNLHEVFPPRLPLSSFPVQLGDWQGTDIAIDKQVLNVLGHGDFLERDYRNTAQPQPGINLFIAYFGSQRVGDTIHSPQNCLPGAGWTPVQNSRITLSFAGHTPFPVNRYVVSKADARQIVLYWYWAHDRGVASEYWAKYYLVADSIKMRRSDGALVRISTLMYPGESPQVAAQRLLPFADGVVKLLNNYIPR